MQRRCTWPGRTTSRASSRGSGSCSRVVPGFRRARAADLRGSSGTVRRMGLRRDTAGPPLALREVATLRELRADWERLEQLDGDISRSYAWAEALEREAGADGRRLLACIRADGTVAGIASLRLQRASPIRVYGFEGQAVADQVGPVCAPADR